MTGVFPVAGLLGVIPGPGLLFGLMLVAAIVGGYAARWVHVPRVVGFLLSGIALKVILEIVLRVDADPKLQDALAAAALPLGAIKNLALGLILFTIGRVFDRTQWRKASASVMKISLIEMGCSAVFVFAGCTVFLGLFQPENGWVENVVLSMLLGMASIATAPAATLFVLQEYDAKGPLTDRILGLTGINNIVCIVLFYSVFLILAAVGAIDASGGIAGHVWLGLTTVTIGSVVLGVFFGLLISLAHARLPLGETLLVFFAVFILLGAGEHWLLEHVGVTFSFLLTALVIGAVFTNVAIDAQSLLEALRTVATPIFAGFFVMAGYELHVGDLLQMGWVGGAYVACRFLGKAVGCRLGLRRIGEADGGGIGLGGALLCQAAVVLGLAGFVNHTWDSEAARVFSTVILGSIVIFELVGPLLLKRCVVQGGEVMAVSLLRRKGSGGGGGSVVRVLLGSLVRLVGWRAEPQSGEASTLTVKHVMRTNVQLIPATATLDEVLHFIERSTYSHFPVVHESGETAGIIHMSELREVIYDPTLRDLVTAVDLAEFDSPVVPMDMTLNDLLDVFSARHVGVLPVVDQADSKHIIGFVEQRDVLRALHRLQQ